jgi:hypothetical protein
VNFCILKLFVLVQIYNFFEIRLHFVKKNTNYFEILFVFFIWWGFEP